MTPSSDDVALLCATRTIDTAGDELGVFTDDTRPTDVQAHALIEQAMTMVLAPLPDQLQASLYGRIQQAVALQAAILVETSFYSEQANAGSIVALHTRLGAMLRRSRKTRAAPASPTASTRSSCARRWPSTTPIYAMPPPPVVGRPLPPEGDS